MREYHPVDRLKLLATISLRCTMVSLIQVLDFLLERVSRWKYQLELTDDSHPDQDSLSTTGCILEQESSTGTIVERSECSSGISDPNDSNSRLGTESLN